MSGMSLATSSKQEPGEATRRGERVGRAAAEDAAKSEKRRTSRNQTRCGGKRGEEGVGERGGGGEFYRLRDRRCLTLRGIA